MLKLYKSDNPSYHYMVVVNNVERIYIGDANCLTYIMASDRRRVCFLENANAIKDEYEQCMDRSRLGYFLNQEALEYYLLYCKPTLRIAIKHYAKIFGVYIKRFTLNHHSPCSEPSF